MVENKITLLTLIISFIWHILVFFRLPHLTWLPGFLNTWLMDNGLILYKDVVDPHFPFSYFFLYPFLKISNWNLQTDPILSLAVALITCLGIYYFGRRFLTPIGTTISLVFFSVFYWYFSVWVQISQEGIQGLMLIPILYFLLDEKRILNSFLFGLLVSVYILTGQIVIILSITILLFLLFSGRGNFMSLAFGLLAPFVLTSIYFLSKGSLNDFIFWNGPYYLTYARLNQVTGGSLPWLNILVFYSPIIFLLPLILNKQFEVVKKTSLHLLFLIISTIPLILFSVFHPHHFLFALPLLSIAAGFSIPELLKSSKFKLPTFVIITLISVYLITTVISQQTSRFIPGWQPKILSGDLDQNQYQTVEWLKNNSPQNSRISVVGDPLFYFRSERLPANNRYSVLPWHWLPLNETKRVIDKNPPEFWVIDKHFVDRLIYGWKTPQIVDLIREELQSCYKLMFANTEWEVWQRFCNL